MSERDSYKVLARHYDSASQALKTLKDLPFYVDLARKSRGPVLELACGTGRVLLPIAREGIEIEGVDSSPAMLGVLRERLEREKAEVRARVELHSGDMRTCRLNRRFALVTIPFRPMQHMYAVADQVAALENAAEHLEDDGRLAFDVFFPRFDLLVAGLNEEKEELHWTEEASGRVVRRSFRKEWFDKIHQNFGGAFVVRTYEGEKLVREETEPVKLGYYTYPHLQAVFLLAGLEVIEEYGSWQKAPLDNDATEMIFVLRKNGEK